MRKELMLVVLFAMLLTSCQKESKNEVNAKSENNVSIDKEVGVVKSQLKKGSKSTVGDGVDFQIQYADADVKLEEQIVKDILKQHGFRFLTKGEFHAKIKEVFKFQIDNASEEQYFYINAINPCSKEIAYYKNNFFNYDGAFIYQKSSFISPLFAIPELVDYQYKFPELVYFEEKLPYDYKNSNGDVITIKKWMDEKDLAQKRDENIKSLVARNKYLFNNSEPDFLWLKTNDEEFLKSLVKSFGYVNDPELLTFVLHTDYKHPDELEKILWNKRCSGEVVFNKEIIDVISHSKPYEQSEYLKAIQEYIVKEVLNKKSPLNFSKKAEILGKLAYYGETLGEKVGLQYQFFSSLNSIDGKEYEKEFKKNNYYNISDFKRVWNETKMGGVALLGIEKKDF
ncbi:hypothetical protein [Chryseobacterium oryctis]|uniref:Lipoprotein n=1 Tax=Chryseobacterium oryctis TaxID=2952618 RepID=A0ABT3HNS7_9FLAO|nr:hypothetical protein [Chryseobacterium oryctis]MCW3161427.1 hypothetical protein [Chryseobacterium oryctis]